MRPILVVGAHGQLGKELMARHDAERLPLFGTARSTLDITDAVAVMALITDLKPLAVINAAAYTMVDKAEAERAAAFAVNRDGAANLATACNSASIPLIHLSTDYVFDGRKNAAYRETDAVAPLNVYGASKLSGEQEVQARADRHVVLRTSWIFSSFGTNFVKTMVRLGAERSELRVVNDQVGNPTGASDIADALLAIVDRLASGDGVWGLYHFAGAPATTWYDFACAIFEAARPFLRAMPTVKPIRTKDFPTRARRPSNSTLDCAKFQATFGLAQPNWRHRVEATIAQLFMEADPR
jgi:dTDP-4-dehydrorhamnose reductase